MEVKKLGAKRPKGFGENFPRTPRGCHEVTGGWRKVADFEY